MSNAPDVDDDAPACTWPVEDCSLAADLHVYDVTLRDGEQAPGVSFAGADRRAIARRLDELGVRYVEAGFPALGPDERTAIGAVTDAVADATVTCLASATRADVDSVLDVGASAVSVFAPGSDVQLRARETTPGAVLDAATDAVQYAADHGLHVRFAVTDATRTPPERVREFARAVETAGADLLGLSDTVGTLTPRATRSMLGTVEEWTDLPLSVHCHDDLGMATANALAAAEAGATQIHTTVTGVGENGGNTPLAPLAVALALHHDRRVVDLSGLTAAAELVAERGGFALPPTAPVVGANAFRYVSRARTDGVRADPATYEGYSPELVGATRTVGE